MKKVIFNLFLAGFMILSIESLAQRWKNDPTYSIHNYKQPNKAAVSSERQEKSAGTLENKQVMSSVSRNYKAQNDVHSNELIMISVINTSPERDLISRNYKQQFQRPKKVKEKNIIIEDKDSINARNSKW